LTDPFNSGKIGASRLHESENMRSYGNGVQYCSTAGGSRDALGPEAGSNTLNQSLSIGSMGGAIGNIGEDDPDRLFHRIAQGDGVAWITGVEFSEGTIELEIKGKNQQGRSFVGIAFHGQDNRTFDAVYLRPFNFHAAEQERRSHSIQYISMPGHDWNELRNSHPGKYEFAIMPAPDPDSWVKLKLVVKGKNVAAFVNGSDMPAVSVELLNDRIKGKVGLWVGNGSDGWFRNLKIVPASN
jgi:hypothetical protein